MSAPLLDIVKNLSEGNPVPLSPKLQLIYENLLADEDVWDLCCDHGYLGWAALESGRFEDIYFVDQVPHIIENLESALIKKLTAKKSELSRKAHFRIASAGLLQENLTGTVVIAGVGAYTAFEILQSLWQKQLLQAKRLILSPQRDDEKFLRWLAEFDPDFKHRYPLKSKQSVYEGRRPLWVYVCGE